ncbi:MAG: four helix bundle protein [Candidatus Omnitrophica bacterium]|nr:four helix bundle protein [Candidatus Omnitrophota bacterium]
MDEKIKTFRDLRVWQKGIELVKLIYKITDEFPKDEQYGLTAQLRRAAISIPSNISEGFRRKHDKEHKQFLSIALGSCSELETQIVIAKELHYIDEVKETGVLALLNYICAMIVNLSKKI